MAMYRYLKLNKWQCFSLLNLTNGNVLSSDTLPFANLTNGNVFQY